MNRSKYATTIVSHSSLVELTIEYSQPLKRGREIFGSVVPYGQLWRLGANGCTTLFTSQDLRFEAGALLRGKYALYAVPRQKGWTILFYTDTSNYGLPRCWDQRAVALVVDVPARISERVSEVFTIAIEQTSHFEANIEIAWDQTRVSVPFAIPSQSDALKDAIPASGGPSFDDYYMAASFFYNTNDLHGALLRIDMGLELNQRKPYFYYLLKSLIEAKQGRVDEAIQYADRCLLGAREAGDTYFAQLATDSISQWSELRSKSLSEEVDV